MQGGTKMPVKTRKCLDEINLYITAKSIESVKREYGLETIIKLGGNENTMGFSPKVKEAVDEQFQTLSYYPDMNVTSLREALSSFHGVKEEELVFGNGSFELISILAQTFLEAGEESIIIEPSFGWYKSVTLQMGGKIVSIPLEDFNTNLDTVKEKITEKTRIIWLCNPNNPVGSIIKAGELYSFLKEIKDDVIVVLDEAYVDFVEEEDFPDTVSWINEFQNIIILRTFSKAYGLASFRIGYGIADERLIHLLQKVRLPINTNATAQIAALAALKDQDYKNYIVKEIEKGRNLYYQKLKEMGLQYVISNGNFILFDTTIDSEWVVNEFLKRGIIIRAGLEFGLPTWVRISIGSQAENETALSLLKEVLQQTLVLK